MPIDRGTAGGDGADIRVRELRFGLGVGLPGHSSPHHPDFSHAANAFRAALPQLAPYFIHSTREASAAIADPVLKAQIALFVSQEAPHAQQHRALNELLAQRY